MQGSLNMNHIHVSGVKHHKPVTLERMQKLSAACASLQLPRPAGYQEANVRLQPSTPGIVEALVHALDSTINHAFYVTGGG